MRAVGARQETLPDRAAMNGPGPLDHALALVLAVFFPIRSRTFGFRRLREAPPERVPQVRANLYRQALLLQWTFTLAALSLWVAARRPWEGLGLVLQQNLWTPVFAVVLALVVAYIVATLPRALRDHDALAGVRRRLAGVERMLPRTDAEMKAFWALSLTAGICEELLYRGYLFWYIGHWLPQPYILLVAALIFGIGHSYQGRRGVITTGLAGLFLGGVYMLTGSLYLSMAFHALTDVYSGYVGRAALRATEGETYESTGIA
jgi:membrane protease YdiL (CAAX protease family)